MQEKVSITTVKRITVSAIVIIFLAFGLGYHMGRQDANNAPLIKYDDGVGILGLFVMFACVFGFPMLYELLKKD